MRVSRTVLWEGEGAIPLPDPINGQVVGSISAEGIKSKNLILRIHPSQFGLPISTLNPQGRLASPILGARHTARISIWFAKPDSEDHGFQICRQRRRGFFGRIKAKSSVEEIPWPKGSCCSKIPLQKPAYIVNLDARLLYLGHGL